MAKALVCSKCFGSGNLRSGNKVRTCEGCNGSGFGPDAPDPLRDTAIGEMVQGATLPTRCTARYRRDPHERTIACSYPEGHTGLHEGDTDHGTRFQWEGFPMREAPGRKDDGGKLRASLLPKGTIAAVLRVLEFGARKYGEENWRGVPDARRRYYDAADRHLRAWWEGEANDPDTGESHLAHALCCCLFLLALDKGAP